MYLFLWTFLNDLNKFKKLNNKEKTGKRKTNIYPTASELYNELWETYLDEYFYLSHVKRKKMNPKYKLEKLFSKGYDYSMWSKNEESTNKKESIDKEECTEVTSMILLEGDEEKVKVGAGLKILTPNKLLTRLLILAQIKAGNHL